MAMTMESLYSGRQDVRKLYTGDTKPATGSAGIIKFSTSLYSGLTLSPILRLELAERAAPCSLSNCVKELKVRWLEQRAIASISESRYAGEYVWVGAPNSSKPKRASLRELAVVDDI